MRYNLLGNTGLLVSELCLGTMTFGGEGTDLWAQIGQLQIDDVSSIIKRSFDAGINFIDTANVYATGKSESLTGAAIKKLGLPREQLVIATKATGAMGKQPNDRGQSRYHLMNQLDASLKRLDVDHIDLYQLHSIDPVTPVEEALSTLNDMVRSGKVRYVGVSNWPAWQIMMAQGICRENRWARPETVQAYYTIAGRDLEREIVPMVQNQKMGIMVWSPLAGGILSGKYSADGKGPEGSRRTTFDFPPVNKDRAFKCVDAMRIIGKKYEVSVAQVALSWLLHQKAVTTVIIGAKNVTQLDDNIRSTALKLSPEDLVALNEVSQLPPEYPGWMLERQSAGRVPPAR